MKKSVKSVSIFIFLFLPLLISAQPSIEWSGTYRGILPCADCEGMITELTLNKNKTYDLITRIKGKETTSAKAISGNLSLNKAGTIITLGGIKKDEQPAQYTVEGNKVIQLDITGNPVAAELADKFTLIKGSPSLEEKYWKLITLYGSTVSPETGDRKEHHIMLKVDGSRITGSSGCNSFSGDYKLMGETGISITKLIATKTACPVMDSESLFMKALEFSDNYIISGDTLQIQKAAMTPVAKFVAVYKK